MRITAMYSFNKGEEVIAQNHRPELDEVLQIIDMVDAEQCKTNVRKRILYSPSALNNAFKQLFSGKGWYRYELLASYSQKYYVSGYLPNTPNKQVLRDIAQVKNRVGVEYQFGDYRNMVYDVNAKMTIFAKQNVIDCGIEIVPVKGLADDMSTGVSYFEQIVWDLEHRGISDIPVLIIGIDTDGIRPKDLKIAESKQQYLLFSEL
jgi:Restriction endonuclease BglII